MFHREDRKDVPSHEPWTPASARRWRSTAWRWNALWHSGLEAKRVSGGASEAGEHAEGG
jgi:hypothetical protein